MKNCIGIINLDENESRMEEIWECQVVAKEIEDRTYNVKKPI